MTKILDHGSLEIVNAWGSDESIVEAARLSTQKGFQGWGSDDRPGDEKLLRYLWKNKHMSPFEMAGATFDVKAPIFVVHQWQRHRTQSYNEASARYSPLPDSNYVPSAERLMMRDASNKQAGAVVDVEMREDEALNTQQRIQDHYEQAEYEYQRLLRSGITKELARLVLPVGRYTLMRASANLRNWLQFLELRQDSHAQWEIRQYADAINAELCGLFPRTMELFNER